MMSFGVYPDVSLASARKTLYEARELVQKGINPIEEKNQQEVEEDTSDLFSSIAKEYLAKVKEDASSHHYQRSESLLRLYATPKLGKMKMNDIDRKDVQKLVVVLADSGKKESAKKLFGVLQLYSLLHCSEIVVKEMYARILSLERISSRVQRKFPTITEPTQVKKLLEDIKGFEGAHWSQNLLFCSWQ